VSFYYANQTLMCEDVALTAVAHTYHTPLYVYSQTSVQQNAAAYTTAVATAVTPSQPTRITICYAVKANNNPHLLHLLAQSGLGADVTSGGELFLAQHAGFAPHQTIYSGVGKQAHELAQALDGRIRALHVESAMELDAIAALAQDRQQVAPIGVRVNPNIAAATHPYIATGQSAHKFGVAPETAVALLHTAHQHPWLQPIGLAAHIGSQIMEIAPFVAAAQFLRQVADELAAAGLRLDYLDVGGGLGIDYALDSATPRQPTIQQWVTAVADPILSGGYDLVLEPGRSLVGPAGALLTRVIYTKSSGDKQFIIVDAAMNDLIRPTLYQAQHPVWPVQQANLATTHSRADIVGPVCETGDWLARDCLLPPMQPGDLLCIRQTGAYGYAMSSNYNGRLRPAELLIHGTTHRLIRQRQTYEHLLADTDFASVIGNR
jgi:diaminopimelate decarboxylase